MMFAAIATVVFVVVCVCLMLAVREASRRFGPALDGPPERMQCRALPRVAPGTRGNAPHTGSKATHDRRARRLRAMGGAFMVRQSRRVAHGLAVLCLGGCFNAAGQFDGAATLKASKAAAHLICAAVGALDALPDSTPLLIDRNGGVRVESSGGAQ